MWRESPSPQGRVGTRMVGYSGTPVNGRRPLKVGSEHVNYFVRFVATNLSPSPQGRVGTDATLETAQAPSRRRPLKVGSEQVPCWRYIEDSESRRPLKVGSEP